MGGKKLPGNAPPEAVSTNGSDKFSPPLVADDNHSSYDVGPPVEGVGNVSGFRGCVVSSPSCTCPGPSVLAPASSLVGSG